MSSSQPSTIQNAPHLLLCEALGFSPQLLLDDIINIANNAVQDGVNGMEEFLQKWADERIADSGDAPSNKDLEATNHEVEQGLVAFQTLLEYHTDIAFDFFEAWCLRNIFMIPPGLPIVLPHQEGLDMSITPEQDQEKMDEIEQLRKTLDGHRKLNRYLTRAIRTSTRQLASAESRLSHLSSLLPSGGSSQALDTLPQNYLKMCRTLSSLPPLDILPTTSITDPGKRKWETSKTGYVNWALERLIEKERQAQGNGRGEGHGEVDKLVRAAAGVGGAEEVRGILEVVGNVEWDSELASSQKPRSLDEVEPDEGDSIMDE